MGQLSPWATGTESARHKSQSLRTRGLCECRRAWARMLQPPKPACLSLRPQQEREAAARRSPTLCNQAKAAWSSEDPAPPKIEN